MFMKVNKKMFSEYALSVENAHLPCVQIAYLYILRQVTVVLLHYLSICTKLLLNEHEVFFSFKKKFLLFSYFRFSLLLG